MWWRRKSKGKGEFLECSKTMRRRKEGKKERNKKITDVNG